VCVFNKFYKCQDYFSKVWLDDYKHYLYRGESERYAKVETGDLTKEKLTKKNLNCKPFQYLLEFVMPDMLERYPYIDPGVFASGVIQSEADLELCVDTLNKQNESPIGLFECHDNLTNPDYTQDFVLSWHRQIKKNDRNDICLDTHMTSLWVS
jgi:polypeptide N-acetylgalactosaminyltransferase